MGVRSEILCLYYGKTWAHWTPHPRTWSKMMCEICILRDFHCTVITSPIVAESVPPSVAHMNSLSKKANSTFRGLVSPPRWLYSHWCCASHRLPLRRRWRVMELRQNTPFIPKCVQCTWARPPHLAHVKVGQLIIQLAGFVSRSSHQRNCTGPN